MTNAQWRDRVEELEAVVEKVCDELEALREDLREVLGQDGRKD
jgi:hypothetical protein